MKEYVVRFSYNHEMWFTHITAPSSKEAKQLFVDHVAEMPELYYHADQPKIVSARRYR